MKRNNATKKSPELQAKKNARRKKRVAAKKIKVDESVKRRTRTLSNELEVTKRALNLAAHRIAELHQAFMVLKQAADVSEGGVIRPALETAEQTTEPTNAEV